MSNTNIRSVRVIRYAPDGGYAAREWLAAFEGLAFPHAVGDGDTWRMGAQITKKRVVDVVVRIEKLDGFTGMLRTRLGRTVSDTLFRNPDRCAASVPGAERPLAVLGAKHLGEPVRILVCAAGS